MRHHTGLFPPESLFRFGLCSLVQAHGILAQEFSFVELGSGERSTAVL